jgi:uncharacterized protein YbjT (DUF2867 family)
MKVLLFGATGMVGQGVMRECFLDPEVELVRSVGRSATGQQNPKLRETVLKDLTKYDEAAEELAGFDACFFCLGVSSAGMTEADYTRITYGITIAAAEALISRNPGMTFVYVSGVGTDSSEKGRTLWARVKGRVENTLLRMPFKAAYMFRPGVIVPMHGIESRTAAYRIFYKVLGPVMPMLRAMLPNQVLTTEEIGKAMLIVARRGAPKSVLEPRDIRALLS